MPEDTGRTLLKERKEDWPRSFLYMISWSVLKCILNYKKKKEQQQQPAKK